MSTQERQARPAFSGGDKALAIILLLFMGVTWGGSLSLSKLATTYGGHPVGLALWQTTASGLLLFGLSALFGRLPPLRAEVLRFNLVCGITGIGLPALGLFWSAKHLPAGVVAIAFASMPLLTYGLSAALRVERAEAARIVGVAIGLAAVLLLVLPEGSLPEPEKAPWVLVALAASVSMSVENVWIALKRPAGLDDLPLSCGRQLAGALVLAPLALGLGKTVPLFVPWGPLQWAATGTAIASAAAYTTLLYVIRTSGAGVRQPDRLCDHSGGGVLGHGDFRRTPFGLHLGGARPDADRSSCWSCRNGANAQDVAPDPKEKGGRPQRPPLVTVMRSARLTWRARS